MTQYRYCNTHDLLFLARKARSLKTKNPARQLSDEFLSRLDPDGAHLIVLVVFGHNDTTIDRCRVLAKMAGTTEPGFSWLDMEHEYFERLHLFPVYTETKEN